MTTTPLHIVDKRWAAKYTGTNSADLDALITQFDIVSESGGTLNFTSASSSFTAFTNDWIIYTQGMVYGVFNQAGFDNFFSCNASCSDLSGYATTASLSNYATTASLSSYVTTAALTSTLGSYATTASVTALTNSSRHSIGVAAVPSLIVNQTATLQITISPTMPSTSYTAYSKLFAGISITGLTINSTTVVSASRVDVVVQNLGLITLAGANVLVFAQGN